MTKNRSLMLLLLVVLLVNLILGEDSEMSRIAVGTPRLPVEQQDQPQWAEAPELASADSHSGASFSANSGISLPAPVSPAMPAAAPPSGVPSTSSGPRPEWQAPRVELLYAD